MPRAILREHKGHATNRPINCGDEAFITLPSAPADATVTCTVTRPDGETLTLQPRHREGEHFADHVAVVTVDQEGHWRYLFTVDGKRAGGQFMVRPAKPPKRKRKGKR